MIANSEFIVVGAGLTGAVIARAVHDAGRRVLVLDRRAHIAGNVHDHAHASGVRIHTYGPHHFRTNDEDLWAYVNRFARFFTYEPAPKALVDGRHENWPIAASYIARTVGADWKPDFVGRPTNFEEASLAKMPRLVYEKFVRGYTEKQWGVPATALGPELASRFQVHADDEPRLMRHVHQGIPVDGYARMVQRMLEGIPVLLHVDYLAHRDAFKPSRMLIFTGPIDEFFGFDLGRLAYRGQQRAHDYHPDVDWLQPSHQVNNPDPANGPHVRTIEWKHMMKPEYARRISGTVLTRETPFTPSDPGDYEYPFPDQANRRLYERYRDRARALDGVLICGRLGEYRYYDMDHAIARARLLARRLLHPGALVATAS